MFTPFSNEPYVDFTSPGPRQQMLEAIESVRAKLGRTYPLQIGDKRIETGATIRSINPAKSSETVGLVAKATPAHAEQAIVAAAEMFPCWSRVPAEARARYLVRAAALLRRRLLEFSAWMCFEESKTWPEAYADACEAVDFMEFYAREMVRLSHGQPVTPYPGEENEYRYVPLGVGVVIPPWNFPLAICVGMTTAAIVTGNTVVLKPASASPVIAAKFVELMNEVGLPPGVLNFCPGSGGEVGDALVLHPKTRFIAFTGSRDVGLGIFEKAARVQPGQIWLKRTVLEMGGKDAILVDETYEDVEFAAQSIVASAFGFQGQKCSACSRLILHDRQYDRVLSRVVELARGLTIGNPAGPSYYDMGAVIDESAQRKISEYIAIGKREGRAVLADGKVPDGGYFIPPTIIAEVRPDARIAQEEIFGPLLAVIRARDFDEGLAIANGTVYGLTGALFSNDRGRLERARQEFHVGNLYLNRKCTGALVDVQPFGGFNMSGTNSKAGGRDYLPLFMQGKSICERL
ncbi:MAG: L-glutamate gamma-semialdehyde dehydrogenase [Phycisphaerae bacterium]|nr:L-glutamate gamma-semialdehyde dehydrogenase [Phycisphaerae bacterium]